MLDIGTIRASVKLDYDSKGLSRLDSDMKKAGKTVDQFDGKTSKLSTRLKSGLKTGALAAGAALGTGFVIGAKRSISAASNLEESINKSNETFEKSSKTVMSWSKTSAKAMGLSQAAALEGASSIGAMLKPMGVAPQSAAKMSMTMTQLAADMASFNNQDPTEMLDRIRAGLSGESEPLKKFGAVLSETRVKAHAWAVGIAEGGTELTEQQKIMARYSLLLKDTADQQGDFGRTSDSLANQKRVLSAAIENLEARLGTALLPIMSKVVGFLIDTAVPALNKFISEFKKGEGTGGDFKDAIQGIWGAVKALWPTIKTLGQALGSAIDAFSSLPGPAKTVVASLAAFAAIGGKLFGLAAVFGGVKSAATGLFTVIRMAPLAMGVAGVAIMGLVTAAYLIIKNWDWVKKTLGNVWNWIKRAAGDLAKWVADKAKRGFLGPIPLILANWKKILEFVKDIPGKIGRFLSNLGRIILSPFKWAADQIKNVLDRIVGFFDGAIKKIKGVVGGVGNAIGAVGDAMGFREGGPVGPGAGGPRLFLAGEGNKKEWVISQEGDRKKNQAWTMEAASALGIPGFRNGGKPSERINQRIANIQQNMSLKRREFELSGGKLTAGEIDRLIRLNEGLQRAIRDLIGVTKGQAKKDARFALRDAQLSRRDLLAEKKALLRDQQAIKNEAFSQTPNVDSFIDDLETQLALAEAGYGGDAEGIRAQLKQRLEQKLAILRNKLSGTTNKDQIAALNDAIRGTLGDLAGLGSGSSGPSFVEQAAAASQMRYEALAGFGSNAMQMGLGSGGRTLAKAGGTTVVLNGEFKLDGNDPHSSVRKLGYQIANNLA